MRDMKQNNFLKIDDIEDVVINYESPIIQIEEVVVEHGFALSLDCPEKSPIDTW